MPERVVDPKLFPVGETLDDTMGSNGPNHENDRGDDGEDDHVGQMAEQAQIVGVTLKSQSAHRCLEGRKYPPTDTNVNHRQRNLEKVK